MVSDGWDEPAERENIVVASQNFSQGGHRKGLGTNCTYRNRTNRIVSAYVPGCTYHVEYQSSDTGSSQKQSRLQMVWEPHDFIHQFCLEEI
jgi:hypothetical protein